MFFLLVACSREKPADIVSQTTPEAEKGSYSIEITPKNVARDSMIYLVPHGFTLADAQIEWLVNGTRAKSSMVNQFYTSDVRKNDTVQAKVIIQGQELLSNSIEIRNSPPIISHVKILPEVYKPGDTLSIEVSGSDIDDDAVIIAYQWTLNGKPAGTTPQLESAINRGDKVDITLTPSDGEIQGKPVILHREINNLPPTITESMKYEFNGSTFTQQVSATDPDGDVLVYSLKSAPPGMTINKSTGLISWKVPPDFTGTQSFSVSITDGHGGEVAQDFNFKLLPEQRTQNIQ